MQDWIDQHQTEFWFAVFPLYFGTLWCVIGAFLSYVGGWTKLARRFRCQTAFVGDRWRFQSGAMRGSVQYGNCLTLGSNSHSLYLAVFPLFRFRHPPLLIPWQEVTATRRQLLFYRWVRLELGRDEHIPLSIHSGLADRLQAAAGDSWPIERPL